MVKINSTHVFLIDVQETYIYSKDTGFVKMQNMIRYRHEPTCGLHDNLVWVAGGLIGVIRILLTGNFDMDRRSFYYI